MLITQDDGGPGVRDGEPLQFVVSRFDSRQDNIPKPRMTTWPGLVHALMRHTPLPHKYAASLWAPARFVPGETRSKAAVLDVTQHVSDLDDGTDVETLQFWVQQYEYVLSSTYSHTPEHPKLRLVIELKEPIPADQYDDVWRRINLHILHGHVDPSTRDASRMYFVPSCPEDGPEPIAIHHSGEPLDWRALPPVPRPPAPVRLSGAVTSSSDLNRKRAQALLDKWTDDLAGEPEGGRHHRLLQLARSAGGLVAAGVLSEQEATDHLLWASVSNGLAQDDGEAGVRRTLQDGIDNGKAEPWVPDDLPDRPLRVPTRLGSGLRVVAPAQPEEEHEPRELVAIPTYPLAALPVEMRELVEAGARAGLPMTLLGGAALAAVAAALGAGTSVVATTGWVERAILWIPLLAPRGAGKSPAQQLAFKPLRAYDRAVWGKYRDQVAAYSGKDDQERPKDPTILFGDATLEALARRLAQTSAVPLNLDELSVLLRGLGEYKRGGGGDRGRFLELWTGDDWRYTRVGGAAKSTNAVDLLIVGPTLVICGGLQPRLHALLGGEDDGMRPRWLPHLAEMPEPRAGVSGINVEPWTDLLTELIRVRDKQRQWELDQAARRRFGEWQARWKEQARNTEESASTSAALVKADVHLLRIALVLAEAQAPGLGGDLPRDVIDAAAEIVEFTLDCWRALPEDGGLGLSRKDEMLDAAVERLKDWLEQHGGRANRRALLHNNVAGVRKARDLDQLLQSYEETYPGTIAHGETTDSGGRPPLWVSAPPRRRLSTRLFGSDQTGGIPPAHTNGSVQDGA